MALLALQQIGQNTSVTPVAAATSNTAAGVDDRMWFEVTVGGTATTLTLVVPGSYYGQPLADVVATSVSNTKRDFPLDVNLVDSTTGLAELTCSQVTGVTIALRRR